MENINFIIERKILKLGNRLIATRNEKLKPLDLTSSQSETLLFFSGRDGARILDLKEYLNISHQAAQKIVNQMQKKGLLCMTVSSDDARAKSVLLTERGKELCSLLKSDGEDVGRKLLNNLSEEEKHTLCLLLDKIT